jgi:hypothetical protein
MPLPPVNYYRQEDVDYCGAACLRMVIQAVGGPLLSQASLFTVAHAQGAEDPKGAWRSPPDGVASTLQEHAAKYEIRLLSRTGELALTRQQVWSLFSGVPPIAMVYGNDHWVVVVNYDISRDPTGPDDTGYDIRAVEIHNPWRHVGEGDPPPPPPPTHVPLETWRQDYLMQVPKGFWQNHIVAVCGV